LGYASLRVVAWDCGSMFLLSRLVAPVPRSSVFVVFIVSLQSVCRRIGEDGKCKTHEKALGPIISGPWEN
jgi:hypothetical protein